MFEAIVALLILVLLLLSAALPPASLVWAGAAIALLGAIVGVPAGLVYHARLWQGLQREGLGTKGFWLHPTRLHEQLSEAERRKIAAGFWVGVVGFVACLGGALLVLVGVVRILVV